MWVFGIVEGEPDSASAEVSVRLNANGTGHGGMTVDSTVLDSAGAAILTVIATDGLELTPKAGVHVFPVDTVVPYSFTVKDGFVDLAVVKDDTGTTATGTVTMSRSHVLEGATRINYLLNPDIVEIRNRYRQLLTASNTKHAYAALLTSYSGLAARRSQAYADSVFMIADRLAFDLRSDSSALRALDDALGGTFFFPSACGDSLVFNADSEGGCGILALRAVPTTASIVADSNFSHVIYVNGIHNTRKDAHDSFLRLVPIVAQTSFSAKAKSYLYYNPTFREQQKGWDTDKRICAAQARRYFDVHAQTMFYLADYATCALRDFIRPLIEVDISETVAQKLAIQYGLFTPRPEIVTALAAYVPMVLSHKRSVMFVAHSQGNMVVDQALRMVAEDQPLVDRPAYCTALLSLASPIAPASFVLPDTFRFHLTVDHDILRGLGMEYGILSLQTPISEAAGSAINAVDPLLKPELYLATKYAWGTLAHGAKANYFEPDISIAAVKNRLNLLRSACHTD
jgi:hypothetical protein